MAASGDWLAEAKAGSPRRTARKGDATSDAGCLPGRFGPAASGRDADGAAMGWRRDTAEIGSVADAIAEPVDHETMRSELVMSPMDQDRHVRPWIGENASTSEGSHERRLLGQAGGESYDLAGVTEDRDAQAKKGVDPPFSG